MTEGLSLSKCCNAMPKVSNKRVCSRCNRRAEFVSKPKPERRDPTAAGVSEAGVAT